MKISLPEKFYWDESLSLGEETTKLTKAVWPNFLVEESDISDPALKFTIELEEIEKRIRVFGIRHRKQNRLAAFAYGVLIPANPTANTFPDSGWRYAMESFLLKETPNCFCLLAANVDSEFKDLGLAQRLLEKGKAISQNLDLEWMIGPVRPNQKNQFPHSSMEEYLSKRTIGGEIYDPWLRIHVRYGAEVLNVCSESVIVKGSLSKWREWTGLDLRTSGQHIISDGLAPLQVDLKREIGTYCEPNVWVRYKIE